MINIAIVSTGVSTFLASEMWLSVSPESFSGDLYTTVLDMVQFTDPIPIIAGSNVFGLLEITERRTITPSYLDMMGFTPVRDI